MVWLETNEKFAERPNEVLCRRLGDKSHDALSIENPSANFLESNLWLQLFYVEQFYPAKLTKSLEFDIIPIANQQMENMQMEFAIIFPYLILAGVAILGLVLSGIIINFVLR